MLPDQVMDYLANRAAERNGRLTSRLAEIRGTEDVPDREGVLIDSARETRGAILFVDLVNSTQLAIRYAREPDKMLATLNLLVPTLMDAARCYGGEFEKNTGDGVLAYFGMGSSNTDEFAASTAIGSADAMLWTVRSIVNPYLRARGLQEVQVTIGADLGGVLLARIGLQRVNNGTPLVAVGLVANRAAKIQGKAAPNQARIGEDLFKALPKELRSRFATVFPVMPWPFRVARTPADMALEQMEAEREAREESERRWARTRAYSGMLPQIEPFVPATPRYVSPTRPYRVYLLKQTAK